MWAMRNEPLHILFQVVPSQSWVADELGICRQAVSAWREVPIWAVPHLIRVTGLPRGVLRPDVYPGEVDMEKFRALLGLKTTNNRRGLRARRRSSPGATAEAPSSAA